MGEGGLTDLSHSLIRRQEATGKAFSERQEGEGTLAGGRTQVEEKEEEREEEKEEEKEEKEVI